MTVPKSISRRASWLFLGAALAFSVACIGPKGDRGADGSSCTVKDNGDGTETISCGDGTSATVHNGTNGTSSSCSVSASDGGSETLTCTDGTSVTITNGHNGTNGTNGSSCSVHDNGNGTKTISCTDGTSVTVSDGAPSTCQVASTDAGTETITCGGTTVTVTNGTDGSSCSATDNGDGTKTISCTNGTSVTVADGNTCTVHANANGTKTLSCSDGTSVTIAPPLGDTLDPYATLPGVVLHIIGVTGAGNPDGTFAPGDKLAVKFSMTTTAGIPMGLEELTGAEIWVAGPTSNYQHILPSARDATSYEDVTQLATLNEDGTYTYTFAAPIPANYGVPLWDTNKFTIGELSGPLDPGTYTVAMQAHHDYSIQGVITPDVGNETYDFLFGHANALEPREVVTTANCNTCHNSLRAHGGLYRNTQLCATCHTAGAEDANSTDTNDATPVTIELRDMIHKLHNGAHLPSVNGVTTNSDGSRNYVATPTPYVLGGVTPTDYSAVQFPVVPSYQIAMPRNAGYSALSSASKSKDDNIRKGVVSCAECHGTGNAIYPVAAPAQGALYAQPSRAACGSCHDDVDFTKNYVKNGQTMLPQTSDTGCIYCHYGYTPSLDVRLVHTHPLSDPTVTPNLVMSLNTVSGGTGPNGALKAGDSPIFTYAVTDGAGNNVPITALDSFTTMVVGPTFNRQIPFPYATVNGITLSPYDFAGRLAATSTTNKGIMSRVTPTGAAPVSEPLVVQLTSGTNFTVSGRTSGALGTGALAAAVSTNPSGSSIATVYLTPGAVAQALTVSFTSATAYQLLDASNNVIGTGALPAALSSTAWFTSNDGSISFSMTAGTTAFAAGNKIYLTVFKGSAANPVLFAVVAGRTAFASPDRFYYNFIAPAPTYTVHPPMDLPFEYLGDGNGTAGQTLTAGNAPAWYGFQTLYERTALPGTQTTTTAVVAFEGAYLPVSGVGTPVFAVNDFLVIDDGLPTAEYLQVGSVDATANRLWGTTPLRFTHAAGALIKKVTLTYRQEGTDYTLNPATGGVTLTNASTNSFVMSYRTDGRFGWYRKAGDTLQTVFAPPPHNNPNLDETWGNWSGKPYADGTYTAAVWGYRNVPYAFQGEYQAYRSTAPSAQRDFLYGAATTVTPYALISSPNNCQSCHADLSFHGGTRRGPGTCLLCHGVAGFSLASYNAAPPPAGTTVSSETGNFRTLIHNLHFDTFPVMPNGAASCAKCHGTSNVWQSPTDRDHPTAQVNPVRAWRAACSGCHTATADSAHFDAMSPSGVESCAVCHGPGQSVAVSQVHLAR